MVLPPVRIGGEHYENKPRESIQSSAGLLKPGEVGAGQLRADLRQHVSMVTVEPDELFRVEHPYVDQALVDRREGQGLEAEHFLLRTLDLARHDEHEILDPDAVFAG